MSNLQFLGESEEEKALIEGLIRDELKSLEKRKGLLETLLSNLQNTTAVPAHVPASDRVRPTHSTTPIHMPSQSTEIQGLPDIDTALVKAALSKASRVCGLTKGEKAKPHTGMKTFEQRMFSLSVFLKENGPKRSDAILNSLGIERQELDKMLDACTWFIKDGSMYTLTGEGHAYLNSGKKDD